MQMPARHEPYGLLQSTLAQASATLWHVAPVRPLAQRQTGLPLLTTQEPAAPQLWPLQTLVTVPGGRLHCLFGSLVQPLTQRHAPWKHLACAPHLMAWQAEGGELHVAPLQLFLQTHWPTLPHFPPVHL